jgi:hypothetical protein
MQHQLAAWPMRALLLALLMQAPFSMHAPSATAGPQDDQAYLAHLADVKSGAALAAAKRDGTSPALVGLKLRELYTKTSFYKPYSDPSVATFRDAIKQRQAGQFAECATTAERATEQNYTNLGAHFLAGSCLTSANQPEKAKTFSLSFALLAASILHSVGKDGKTPDTSYRVINIGEQYAVMDAMRLKPIQKTLIADSKGGSNDCHTLAPGAPDGRTTICFNVETPLAALGRELGTTARPKGTSPPAQ